ncbi:MAG: FKBP-type peptidyl-prolyl cis-trans isomerase [Bacteroidetes bacterium]|nr:FKBP-type peptidyl-prolyl cis-trans isomerase [Bacteroidota bacterium]
MKKHTLLLGAAALLGLAACNKSEFEGYTKAENGLNYKFYVHDEKGVKPVVGDGVGFSFLISINSTDSVILDSRMMSRDGNPETRILLPASTFRGSLEDAIMMMAKGDSASFIFSADSFFLKTQKLNQLPPGIKPGEKLKATLKIIEVKTKKELEENQKQQEQEMQRMAAAEQPAIENFLAENKITTKPTASGLYFIEEKKGKGANAKAGELVTINYRGTTLSGQEFDSSFGKEPIKFVLGQGRVIPGWEEALLMMSKGGKAKLVIPSALAYGPQGRGGLITPFCTLVFEVEMVNIEKAPEQPEMGAMPAEQQMEMK